MFERFTDRARRTIVQAQEESRALRHNHIGPEHILLALVHEGQGLGLRILTDLGITEDLVRDQLNLTANTDRDPPGGHIPFTPQAKQTLELSLREALQLGDRHIGTEHILLGLIRQDEGPATDALQKLGVTLDEARIQMIRLRPAGAGGTRVATAPGEGGEPGEPGEIVQALDEPLRPEAESMRAGVESLRQEIGRLRALLERHGIDPDEDAGPDEQDGAGGNGGPAPTA